ncbi:MAG: nicotinate-nucleotide adenylyltransferase [Lachnospiraceae bacterium]
MALIGIMGGTFNPIHFGHIAIAKAAFQQFHLDEIWFMPNHIPAYKASESIISGEHRLAMIRLAIQEYPYFKASDYELRREGNTYTYETMHLLKRDYPEDDFFFIMGADSLFYFEQWVYPERIVRNATILAAVRNDRTLAEMQSKIDEMNSKFGGNYFHLIQCPEIPCSSSEIRKKIHDIYQSRTELDKKTEDYLYLPEIVYTYIMKNKLYQ